MTWRLKDEYAAKKNRKIKSKSLEIEENFVKNNKIIKKKMKNKEKESVPSQQFHEIFRIQRIRMRFYLILTER